MKEKELEEQHLLVDFDSEVEKNRLSIKEIVSKFYSESILNRHEFDDAVSVAVKKFHFLICTCILLWLISFNLVMAQIITNEQFSTRNWTLFVPMWLGSLGGMLGAITVSWRVCSRTTVVSKERKSMLIRQLNYDENNYVDHQSLPLMRRLFCWSVVISISFFMIFITQVFYYLWFIGLMQIWDSFISIIFIFVIFLLYMYTVQIFSLIVCFLTSLILLQIGLFILKETGKIGSPWYSLSLPLVVTLLITGYYLSSILYDYLRGKYHFNLRQSVAFIGYFFSYILAWIGVGLTISDSYEDRTLFVSTAYVMWTISITIAVCSWMIIMFYEGIKLADSRGYSQPRSLSRTTKGWDILEQNENPLLFILGDVKREKVSIKQLSQRHSNYPEALTNQWNMKKETPNVIQSYQNGSISLNENLNNTKQIELSSWKK